MFFTLTKCQVKVGLRLPPGFLCLKDKLAKDLLQFRRFFLHATLRVPGVLVFPRPVAEAGVVVAGPATQADEAVGPHGAGLSSPVTLARRVEVGAMVILAGPTPASTDIARVLGTPPPRVGPLALRTEARRVGPAGLPGLGEVPRPGKADRPGVAVGGRPDVRTLVAGAAPSTRQVPLLPFRRSRVVGKTPAPLGRPTRPDTPGVADGAVAGGT